MICCRSGEGEHDLDLARGEHGRHFHRPRLAAQKVVHGAAPDDLVDPNEDSAYLATIFKEIDDTVAIIRFKPPT